MTETIHHAPDYSIDYGSKYQKGMDVAEIAKLVRKDIRAAIKSGALPQGLKVTVRSERFSGGTGIYVKVKEAPYPVTRPATKEEFAEWFIKTYPSEEAKRVEKELEDILGAYNYDGSDTQYDYWNVNFYGSVSTHFQAHEAYNARHAS